MDRYRIEEEEIEGIVALVTRLEGSGSKELVDLGKSLESILKLKKRREAKEMLEEYGRSIRIAEEYLEDPNPRENWRIRLLIDSLEGRGKKGEEIILFLVEDLKKVVIDKKEKDYYLRVRLVREAIEDFLEGLGDY